MFTDLEETVSKVSIVQERSWALSANGYQGAARVIENQWGGDHLKNRFQKGASDVQKT
jgi:hypothetical protein